MHKTLMYSLILVCFISCAKESEISKELWLNKTAELLEHNAKKITIPSGYAGTLVTKEGNCMPIYNPSDCVQYPVRRTIAIYEYTLISQTAKETGPFFNKVNTRLIKHINTDSEGFFQVILDPGLYSIFIADKGKLYANGGDGQGGINPVVIVGDSISYRREVLDYAAY